MKTLDTPLKKDKKLTGLNQVEDFPAHLPLEVHVSKADIKKGVRKNCRMCPMALAIHRAIPNLYDVKVRNTVAIIQTQDMKIFSMQLSQKVADWIDLFDRPAYARRKFKPIKARITCRDIIKWKTQERERR